MRAFVRILVCLVALAAPALAQNYPAKNARMVVGFAAGGPTDVIARLIAQKLTESLGQQFYVENLPGAGGNTANGMVARAPADGYTLAVVSTGFIVNPSLYAKVPYEIKDFVPISLVATSPNVLVVHPSVPAKSVKELVELIKANPEKYSFAHPGIGSTPHLAGELFKLTFNLNLAVVPFAGAGPAIQSTVAGHTPIAFTATPPAIGNIKDGKLRALAVMADKRLEALPDVATVAEAGLTGQESDTLTGIVAPAGTPKEIVDRLSREIAKHVTQPDLTGRLKALGFVPIASNPEQFAARIATEAPKWEKVVKGAKLRIE